MELSIVDLLKKMGPLVRSGRKTRPGRSVIPLLGDGKVEIGCFDKHQVFNVGWTVDNVRVSLDHGSRKLRILFEDKTSSPPGPGYMLQWLLQNVKMVSRPLSTGTGLALVLRLVCPPYVFFSTQSSVTWQGEDDELWARSTDFSGGSLGLLKVMVVTFPIHLAKDVAVVAKKLVEDCRWMNVLNTRAEYISGGKKEINVPAGNYFYGGTGAIPFHLEFLVSALVLKGIVSYSEVQYLNRTVIQEGDMNVAESALLNMLRYRRTAVNATNRYRLEVERSMERGPFSQTMNEKNLNRHGNLVLVRRLVITPTTAAGGWQIGNFVNIKVSRSCFILKEI